MVLAILLACFILMLATGTSIAVSLGLSSAVVFFTVMDVPLIIIPQTMFKSVSSFSFMAVPFFMLAGAFMSAGGGTKRIVAFAMCLVGPIAGGLALVVAVAGMFFSVPLLVATFIITAQFDSTRPIAILLSADGDIPNKED